MAHRHKPWLCLLLLPLLLTNLTTPSSADDEFITKQCQPTRHPGLCVDMLFETGTDCGTAACLALTAANSNFAESYEALSVLQNLTSGAPKELVPPLTDCMEKYDTMEVRFTAAAELLTMGRYKDALDAVSDAIGLLDACETGFAPGKAPETVTRTNFHMKEMCDVTLDLMVAVH